VTASGAAEETDAGEDGVTGDAAETAEDERVAGAGE